MLLPSIDSFPYSWTICSISFPIEAAWSYTSDTANISFSIFKCNFLVVVHCLFTLSPLCSSLLIDLVIKNDTNYGAYIWIVARLYMELGVFVGVFVVVGGVVVVIIIVVVYNVNVVVVVVAAN